MISTRILGAGIELPGKTARSRRLGRRRHAPSFDRSDQVVNLGERFDAAVATTTEPLANAAQAAEVDDHGRSARSLATLQVGCEPSVSSGENRAAVPLMAGSPPCRPAFGKTIPLAETTARSCQWRYAANGVD